LGERPHVVLLMADHLRWDCLSSYGDLAVRTPHLDALAEESVVFERAYCATPLCTPTRCSMYTGKHPHVHGAIVNGHIYEEEQPYGCINPEHRTLYEVLDDAGYGVMHVGVQHCRCEPDITERVPEAYFGGNEYFEHAAERGIKRNPQTREFFVPSIEWRGGRPVVDRRGQHRKTRFPHGAEDFLDGWWSRLAAEKVAGLDFSRPQYVEALFWAPHPPMEVPEPYHSMYPPEGIELPETVGRWYDGQPASLLFQTCGHLGHGRLREEFRETWSAYFGLVTMVDECIGRVVAALRERGIWDDALVVFTQDHGDMLGCHHLLQKNCFYEAAAHVPLLIKPPGGAAGRRAQLASAIDYCPTVCDYAGLESPDGVAGRSLRPVAEQRATEWRDAVFMEYNGDQGRNIWPTRGIVAEADGRLWKYIWTSGDVDELYNVTEDPMEKESLVDCEGHGALRRRLRERLARWMSETGDPVRIEDAG